MILFQERYKSNSNKKENIYTRIEENYRVEFARLDRAIRFDGNKKNNSWQFLVKTKIGIRYFRLYKNGQRGRILVNGKLEFTGSYLKAEELFYLLTEEI